MTDFIWIAGGVAAATLVTASFYTAIWRRFGNPRTPTGFGVILAPLLFLGSWLGGGTPAILSILGVVMVASAVYWLDDLFGLSAWTRVCISAVTGIMIALAVFFETEYPLPIFAILALVAGFCAVGLINMVNFQDGADLNLALFVILTMILILLYPADEFFWTWIAWLSLAFTVAFAFVNARPNTLYFGDSGSFVFGALLTFMGVAFLSGTVAPPPEAAIPAALPFVDTFWVTSIRIRIRQRFTVRHYFHLYQRLQRDYHGPVYLIPQIINVVFCLAVAKGLESFGLARLDSIVVAMIIVTIPVFILCHLLFVRSDPGPPERST